MQFGGETGVTKFFDNVFTKSRYRKKYNADTKLQERSQEKHMVVWL
jgi:hypothetical protein